MGATKVSGSRVAIVGGSIAGCATAIALGRAGCEVTVFERSSTELHDRGVGIVIPLPLRDRLVGGGYLDERYPAWRSAERRWIVRDGDAPLGRELWRQPGVGVMNSWSALFRGLRARVDDARYRDGVEIASIRREGEGFEIEAADGTRERFDVVVGADGYRSRLRAMLHPGSKPRFAGYVLWRGSYPESRIEDLGPMLEADEARAWHTVVYDGGHAVFYPIPGADDRVDPGHRRMNWAVYATPPPGHDFSDARSVPPGEVTPESYAALEAILESFPSYFASVVRHTTLAEVSIQPIYDELVDRYVDRGLVLIGDAGTVTRTHTGSGATKAIEDALCLERLAGEHEDWDGLLAAYDAERVGVGRSLVELGRRIGRAQVEETPPWASMTPADFEAWTKATLAGERLYFYGSGHPAARDVEAS